MGQAKIKQRSAFTPQLIEEWEARDCVNFAVGLARLTGWLLHVDWWSPANGPEDKISIDLLKPLRVYVGDNRYHVFDVRGVRHFVDFHQNIITKLISPKFGPGKGGVDTRFYSEAKLPSLPLRNQPDETLVAQAIVEIQANPLFLAAIPTRTSPYIPAYQAARYTFGKCAVFAEAMRELRGLQPVGLLAVRFLPLFEGMKRGESGYFHSVVLHPDGMAEDAWGMAPLADIASRFGVIEFKIGGNEHRAMVEKFKQNSSDIYDVELKNSKDLINEYRRLT